MRRRIEEPINPGPMTVIFLKIGIDVILLVIMLICLLEIIQKRDQQLFYFLNIYSNNEFQ